MGFFEKLDNMEIKKKKTFIKIEKFIINNKRETLKLTSKEIGEKSHTSSASVVRFCRDIGYDGLEEMKIDLARSIEQERQKIKIDPIISPDDSVFELTQKIVNNGYAALQNLMVSLDFKELKKAIQLIKNTKFLYIYGIGASSLAAMDLAHKLNRVNIKAFYIMDGHTNLEFSALATKDDLAVMFSYSGETKEIYYAAQSFKEKGGKVISITRNKKSTLKDYSDVVLSIPNNEETVRVGAIASKFAQLALVDIIYLGIIHDDFEKAESYLLETSEIVKKLRK